MTPAAVAEGLAAIRSKYPADWQHSPAALAEAAALWGGGCNAAGVFAEYESDQVARVKDVASAKVLLAQSGKGLWAYGLRYDFSTDGGSFMPSVWREAYASRMDARRTAIEELIALLEERNGTPMERTQRLLLEAVRKADHQRTLFG